MDKIIFSVP